MLDVMGKECIARVFQPTTSSLEEDGTLLVQRHRIFDDWTRIENEWMVVRGERATTFRFHHSIYSGLELRCMLEAAGFASVNLYGDLDGAPYDTQAKRLIAVARKAG